MGRRGAVGAACVAAAVVLSGCTSGGTGDPDGKYVRALSSAATPAATTTPPRYVGKLSFTYHGSRPEKETINQTVDIRNDDQQSVVPVLAFTPLDKRHQVLSQVKVRTVYGSDRGNLVVPYGYGMEILRFSGTGAHEVADVRVRVVAVEPARIRAGVHDVTVQPLDGRGRKVDKFSRFTALRLSNADDFAVAVRLAYLVYDQPPEGQTQQAVVVVPVGGLIHVPASGSTLVKVTGAAAAAVARYSGGPAVSIKPYNSQ
ncbi:hypothetical protein [Actinacidiphila rubida]|uniref:Lipoprotein n=1 Tax=Actinacidiphila rubida TaxID=310780 RepID=A0A1H8EQ29_9ACTN|nr:hypothetical protein [Actinacidiphila rubida]SEN20858.1 hypothetical protein SAMN05216267_1002289 [Actinacidiphila rubida]